MTALTASPAASIPYWLLPTILLFPAMLWMFLGAGLPWALALLPRADWRKWPTVLAVAVALGPAMTTIAMFVIGTFGQFSTANVLLASLIMAALGILLARRNFPFQSYGEGAGGEVPPLTALDWTLIALIVVAILVRFWNTAYWPYTTYDEFWVYGYNAKIFMLKGAIPTSMGYYPQLLPLAYTFGQLMWGGINDHAARVVVPIFGLGSILMAYVLGARLFNRRVGLLTAALWALFPQQTAWSQFGDLEIPMTLYFTATVVFFIMGWRERNRRYVILSGVMLGAALWTKPTAGALIESLGLIVVAGAAIALWGMRQPTDKAGLVPTKNVPILVPPLPKSRRGGQGVRSIHWVNRNWFALPLLALLVSAPIGWTWYIRNVIFGHPPLVWPAAYWQQAAQRSGEELGWPLLIAAVLTIFLIVKRQRGRFALAGLALMLAGSLPSAFGWRLPTSLELSQLILGASADATTLRPTHLSLLEFAVITAGAALLCYAAIPLWKALAAYFRITLALIAAFVIPYFVTWFWSYSYHPRLSFAIVPAMIVVVAAGLEAVRCALPIPADGSRRLRMVALSAVIVVLAVPGLLAGLTALEPAITGALPDDHARYASGNPALMALVDYLNYRKAPIHYPVAMRRPMRIEAPGELRLPFFFPLDDVRTDRYPVALDQIADVDYFIDSSVGQRLYNEQGKLYNQILSSLTRMEVMLREYSVDDKNFRFSAYTVNNVQRFATPIALNVVHAQVGDFAELYGWDTGTLSDAPGQPFLFTLWWKAIKPSDLDYSVFIHLWDPRQDKLVGQWGGEPMMGAWNVW
ncbi:MAG TPA: glycosyltransferase family 39 protein, partial [Aggregatilineales bacterium]|nr:glycosyltransferase family 39 protein [Aggregatilineales bacterium]